MLVSARRGLVVLVPLAVVLGVAAPAGAASPSLPEGPWPQRPVLATESAGVPATPDVVSTGCPTATATVRSSAPGTGRTVALTFDDGPGKTTQDLLAVLHQSGVTATFFNLGLNASYRPAEARSAAAVEMQLGNHTWDHPRMPQLSATRQGDQMDAASAGQRTLVGSLPCAFRPPYGEYNPATLNQAQLRRMSTWNWSVDTEDWKAGTSTSSYWVNRIVTRAEAGGSQTHPVVLMHNPPAGVPATVIALPRIIAYYKARGYRFVDLLGQVGQYPAPAVAVTGGGLQLVARFPDGSVRVKTLRGSTWTSWTSLGGMAVGGPAVAAAPAITYAVHLGRNAHVWLRTRTDAGVVSSSWTDLGATGTSKPAVAYRAAHLWVAVRGADRGYWVRELAGRTWGPWTSLGGTMTSAPALAVTADGRLTVTGTSTDGALWVRSRGTTWSSWRRIGGPAGTAEPALAATAGGNGLVALVRGPDGQAWTAVGNTSATVWGAWRSLPGAVGSGAGMSARGATVEAYAYGTDGRIRRDVAANGAAGTGWSGWQLVP